MKSAHAIVTDVATGQVTAEAVVREALTRAEATKSLNTFITLCAESALVQAQELDRQLLAGAAAGPLAGVPVAVKDNICTEGIRSTAASKSLVDFVPPYSATVVERLEAAGAIVIGKTNLDEFGMGSSNENSAFGAVKNPWDTARIPGGSSGGSAVAVAAGVVPLALGTDTGGSVRQPASLTGVIGFKPTYGRLSRYGVIAFASSLDQVGILCRDNRDLALVMDVMSGYDPHDATSLTNEPAFMGALENLSDLKGIRIGVVSELSGKGNSEGVLAVLENLKADLVARGATVGEASLPHSPYGLATYYLVAPAEASSNLARFDGMIYSHRQGDNATGQAGVMGQTRGFSFGPEVRRRILMGTYALSAGYYDAYYGKALKVRRLITDDFERAFAQYDFLLTPTTPSVAYALGQKVSDPLSMYLDDVDTVLANLAGLPAISLPAGRAENGLPCGMQFLAPPLADERLIRLAATLQSKFEVKIAPPS